MDAEHGDLKKRARRLSTIYKKLAAIDLAITDVEELFADLGDAEVKTAGRPREGEH